MVNPTVSVLAGPGDAAAEQERWSNLDQGWVDAKQEVSMGDLFSFEAVP